MRDGSLLALLLVEEPVDDVMPVQKQLDRSAEGVVREGDSVVIAAVL